MIKPMFSIIMPIYNTQNYIARALESCINQSFRDIEIIIVDDCGQDKSMEITKEFASRDLRIKIIHNEKNQGTFASRNNGAMRASGEYLLFLDSDDYLDLSACQRCFEVLKEHKNLDFIMFNLAKEQNNGAFVNLYTIPKNLDKKIFNLQAFLRFYCNKDEHFYNIVGKAIRKEIFLKSIHLIKNAEKLTTAEDILSFMGVLSISAHIGLLADSLYYYCFNQSSNTNIQDPLKILNSIHEVNFVCRKITTLANLKHNSPEYKIFAKYMILILKFHNIFRIYNFYMLKTPRLKPIHRFILSIKKKYYNFLRRKKAL